MKNFLTILFLFAISFISYALEYNDFKDVLDQKYVLLSDAEQAQMKSNLNLNLNDFSKPFTTTTAIEKVTYNVNSESDTYAGGLGDHFYNLDFSEDPFDGLVDILVMGEPLPSPLTTLICCFGVVGILLYYKKKKEAEVC